MSQTNALENKNAYPHLLAMGNWPQQLTGSDMTITHYYPWTRHPRFDADTKQMFNRFFADGEATAEWSPRVDVREEDTRYVILADVPGIDPREIEISMDKGVLTIKGERKTESKTDNS